MSAERRQPRLSALIVNYRSGAFTSGCVRSLRREWARSGFHPDQLETIVVDNDSGQGEAASLRRLEQQGVQVLKSATNEGYAHGLNAAFEVSGGQAGDYVALLNPDLWFLPDSMGTLLSYLEAHPKCGAVGPQTWLDEERSFALPPIVLPTLASEVSAELAKISLAYARRRAATRLTSCLQSWQATAPHSVSMLSGACLFLRRAVVETLGQPMDGRYPLYFEDADLARRLHRLGFSTVLHPQADVVHHWSRSAGFGKSFESGPLQRWKKSRHAYTERWFGLAGSKSLAAAEKIASKRIAKRGMPGLYAFEDLVPGEHPVAIDLPDAGATLLELSPDPRFTLAAGHRTEGGRRWRFPAAGWSWLFPGRYYLRALDLAHRKTIGAWQFDKTTEARSWPVGSQGPVPDAHSLGQGTGAA